MWHVSYRFANLLAAHLSVAPPDGWGIKLVLVNDFKIYAETLQGIFKDIQLWWTYIEVKVGAVKHSSSFYVIIWYLNRIHEMKHIAVRLYNI